MNLNLFEDRRELEKTNVKKCHSAMFRILKYLDYLCKKNNLRYWICGGTLIGAVIHKGWKPLGKDIDISVTKRDYQILLKIVKKNMLKDTDLEIINENFFRIMDRRGRYTKGFLKGKGLCVDVYCIDVRLRLFSVYYKSEMDEGIERKFRKNILLPLRKYRFENGVFYGPNKPISLLRQFEITRRRIDDYLEKIDYHKLIRAKYDKDIEIKEVDFMVSD